MFFISRFLRNIVANSNEIVALGFSEYLSYFHAIKSVRSPYQLFRQVIDKIAAKLSAILEMSMCNEYFQPVSLIKYLTTAYRRPFIL